MASAAHRYDGRPGTTTPTQEADRRTEVEVRGGFGVVGDRYAGRPAHRDPAVTVLDVESLEALAAELGVPPLDPLLARRTVVLRGRGGVRCRPLTDGVLRLGPAVLRVSALS